MANDLCIPVVFPEYKIRVSDTPVVGRLPLLGHAGALALDSQSGKVIYYEYGRYDAEQLGLVRSRTYSVNEYPGGMNAILADVSAKAGHGGAIKGNPRMKVMCHAA